jgi:hypothetical protein
VTNIHISCQLLLVVVGCCQCQFHSKRIFLCCVVGACATVDQRVLSVYLVYIFNYDDLIEVETCSRDVTSDYFIITISFQSWVVTSPLCDPILV